jgi:diguanylate cyclase (GGDEF)-like protein/putative nucleotidyltransferase with HDIG domain
VEQAQSERRASAARWFVATVALAALAAVALTFRPWTPELPARFLVYLLIAIAGSAMNVSFPGVPGGNLSVNYVFTMLGLLELQVPETILLAVFGTAAQTCWDAKRRGSRVKPVSLIFNTSCITLAVLAAASVYHQHWFSQLSEGELLRLTLAGVVYFAVNAIPVSIAIALTDNRSVAGIWRGICNWSFVYYLVGVSIAEMVHRATERLGWAFTLALLPVVYIIYRSYRLYMERLEQEKSYAESLAALHLRTIEALATAIEAKDECTHEHLRRVQVYSLEMAKHLGLSPDEIQALQAASILHDIGKLAVPDYIISKPGKLTPEEFEKMKVHTVVGAEILEQVAFPYPVPPIVRSHHEKWDGSGYPDGLKAEEIPIGARILSAVDCLDALASDRQYRRALPLDEAMDYVASLAGRSFDPQVVAILKENYREFERLAQSTPLRGQRLSKDLVVVRGEAPDAGYEKSAVKAAANGQPGEASNESIATALQEMRAILELTQGLSRSLRMEEVLSVLAERLKQLVPFDCIAVYIREGGVLKAKYVSGEGSRRFASIEIPMGQGLSGWVVENGKPIINGNPSVEPGYVAASNSLTTLNSALSIPLGDGVGQLSGALTLYRAEKDAYNTSHLRILLAIKGEIARAVEGAIQFQQSRQQASTDELTGLPNAGSLQAHLQNELRRCQLQRKPLAVALCELEGLQQVNDRYGSATRRELIQRAAGILRGSCRSSDYVARTSDQEFVILLADARPEELAGKLDSLERTVAKAYQELCGEESSGMSVGLACFPENGAEPDSLLACAGQALAHAKQARQASRNTVLQLADSVERPV